MTSETEKRRGGMSRWRVAGWGLAAVLLLAQAVASWISEEVRWTAFDFVFASLLIGGVGLGVELAVRRWREPGYRAGAALALAAAFLLIWINGAVGIIGSEDNPLNLLYGGVIAIGAIGAIVARGRPRGMARAMTAAAIAQAGMTLLPLVPLALGRASLGGAIGLMLLNGGFLALIGGSAMLFRRAAATA